MYASKFDMVRLDTCLDNERFIMNVDENMDDLKDYVGTLDILES